MKENERISIKPLQDKGHHGEILKTMKGVQGLSRISRSGEQHLVHLEQSPGSSTFISKYFV
jgi:hypothetical protein